MVTSDPHFRIKDTWTGITGVGIVGAIAHGESIEDTMLCAARSIEAFVRREQERQHELAPRLRQDLYRDFPPAEVNQLSESELMGCYA